MIVVTDYVPTATAARAIGVSARTLARWAREGKVTATITTAGGQSRWDIDALRRQLNERKEQRTTEPPPPPPAPPTSEPPPTPKQPHRRTAAQIEADMRARHTRFQEPTS